MQLTTDELQHLRRVFDRVDRDHDGRIHAAEFVKLVGRLNAKLTAVQARRVFERIDTDDSGTIEFGELAAWWADEPTDELHESS